MLILVFKTSNVLRVGTEKITSAVAKATSGFGSRSPQVKIMFFLSPILKQVQKDSNGNSNFRYKNRKCLPKLTKSDCDWNIVAENSWENVKKLILINVAWCDLDDILTATKGILVFPPFELLLYTL